MLYNNDLSVIISRKKRIRQTTFVIFLIALAAFGYLSYVTQVIWIFVFGGIITLFISMRFIDNHAKENCLDIFPLPYNGDTLTEKQRNFILNDLLKRANYRQLHRKTELHKMFCKFVDIPYKIDYYPDINGAEILNDHVLTSAIGHFLEGIRINMFMGKKLSSKELFAINLFVIEPYFSELGIENDAYYVFTNLPVKYNDITLSDIYSITGAPDRETLVNNIENLKSKL